MTGRRIVTTEHEGSETLLRLASPPVIDRSDMTALDQQGVRIREHVRYWDAGGELYE